MAKKKIKRFGKLTTGEKVDINIEVGLDKPVRKAYRQYKRGITGDEQSVIGNVDDVIDESKTPSQIALDNKNISEALNGTATVGDDPELKRIAAADAAIQQDREHAKAVDDVLKGNTNEDDNINLTAGDVANAQQEILASKDELDPEEWQKIVDDYNAMTKRANITGGDEPSIEKLGISDYFPAWQQPIQVGTYTGKIIGSNPIYAAGGGLFPMGIVDARRRALQKAAKAKATKNNQLANLFMADGAPQYNDQLRKMGLDFFHKFGEATGYDFSKLDTSTALGRQFKKEIQRFYKFQANTKDINASVEKLRKSLSTEGAMKMKFIPKSAMGAIADWMDGSKDMEYWYSHPEEFQKIRSKLKAYDRLDFLGKGLISSMKADKIPLWKGSMTKEEKKQFGEFATYLRSHPNYDTHNLISKSFVDIERIKAMAETTVENSNPYYGKKEKEEVVNDLVEYTLSGIGTEYVLNQINTHTGNWNTSIRAANQRRKQEKEHFWETTFNKGDQLKDGVSGIFSSTINPDDRPAALANMASLRGTNLNVRDDGSVYTRVNTPKAMSNKKYTMAAGDVKFQTKDGDWVDLTGYQQYIKESKPDSEDWTNQDVYMMSLTKTSTISGLSMMGAKIDFLDENNKRLNVYDTNVKDVGELKQTATISWGGNVKINRPYYKGGKEQGAANVYAWMVNGEQHQGINPPKNVDSWIVGKVEKTVTTNTPPISTQVSSTDDTNIEILDAQAVSESKEINNEGYNGDNGDNGVIPIQ